MNLLPEIEAKAGGKIVHFQNTTIDPDAEKHDPATWDETGFRLEKKN